MITNQSKNDYVDKLYHLMITVSLFAGWLIFLIYYYAIDKSWSFAYSTADIITKEGNENYGTTMQILAIPTDLITSVIKIGVTLLLLYIMIMWAKSTERFKKFKSYMEYSLHTVDEEST